MLLSVEDAGRRWEALTDVQQSMNLKTLRQSFKGEAVISDDVEQVFSLSIFHFFFSLSAGVNMIIFIIQPKYL